MRRQPLWQRLNERIACNGAVSNIGLRFVVLPLDEPVPIHPRVTALHLATMYISENVRERYRKDREAAGLLQTVARKEPSCNAGVIAAFSPTMLGSTFRNASKSNLRCSSEGKRVFETCGQQQRLKWKHRAA